jgi:hypothetical protein
MKHEREKNLICIFEIFNQILATNSTDKRMPYTNKFLSYKMFNKNKKRKVANILNRSYLGGKILFTNV